MCFVVWCGAWCRRLAVVSSRRWGRWREGVQWWWRENACPFAPVCLASMVILHNDRESVLPVLRSAAAAPAPRRLSASSPAPVVRRGEGRCRSERQACAGEFRAQWQVEVRKAQEAAHETREAKAGARAAWYSGVVKSVATWCTE